MAAGQLRSDPRPDPNGPSPVAPHLRQPVAAALRRARSRSAASLRPGRGSWSPISTGSSTRSACSNSSAPIKASPPLTLGELWATANMLRLALIENLGRAALRIIGRETGRCRSGRPRRAVSGRRMSARCATVLRACARLGALDWREFVEAQSAVERVLREDPAGIYGRMDFASRDYCRRIVERLAQRSPLTELEVARERRGTARECLPMHRHLGSPNIITRRVGSGKMPAATSAIIWLTEGRATLEKDVGYRRRWQDVVAGPCRPRAVGLLPGRGGGGVVAHRCGGGSHGMATGTWGRSPVLGPA